MTLLSTRLLVSLVLLMAGLTEAAIAQTQPATTPQAQSAPAPTTSTAPVMTSQTPPRPQEEQPRPGMIPKLASPDQYTVQSYSPQAHPAPTPTPKPGDFAFFARARAFQFNRINTPITGQNNRRAYELDVSPHVAYHFDHTNFSVGYTYSGATGFGLNGPAPTKHNANVDNTLPGFPLNQEAAELYGQYQDQYAYFSVGNRVLNYALAPNSEGRVTPVSYQNADLILNLSPTLSIGATRIIRWEMRNTSTFTPYTLFTAPYAEASPLTAFGLAKAIDQPAETSGVLRYAVNWHPSPRFVGIAEDYQFYNLVNAAYGEFRYDVGPSTPFKPYVAAQVAEEQSTGRELLGKIDNQTFGLQLATNVSKGLQLIVSGDFMPAKYAFVNAKSAAAAGAPYFAGVGGTTDVVKVGKNRYEVAYGGFASPYTDSLATDPLYTTQITQGMADRRSPGSSTKAALIYTPSRQIRLLASEGDYNYDNNFSINRTYEFDVDGTYYFNKVRPGQYHGLFLRVRIAPRQTVTLPYNFEYQRFQLEYDL